MSLWKERKNGKNRGGERKRENWRGREKKVSQRLWQALQIGTALSTAFHGFLEVFQRELAFVCTGLALLIFKAIFKSL